MNAPTRSESNLKSIRVGKLHFAVGSLTPVDFKSINKAKRHSRELGGAGFVRLAASIEEAKAVLRELRS